MTKNGKKSKKRQKMAKNWELADQFGGQKWRVSTKSRVPPRETEKMAKIPMGFPMAKIQKLPKVYRIFGGSGGFWSIFDDLCLILIKNRQD